MFKKHYRKAFYAIAGALAGYLIVHPYTMIILYLTGTGHSDTHWRDVLPGTFDRQMLPMASAFMLFSGFIGFMTGVIIDKKKKLHEAISENEKKKVALETLRRLMVTLSHYLLNANTVIGGTAHRCIKHDSREDILASIQVIENEAKKVEAVIKALKKITEIKIADYTSGGRGLMIDIAGEIEELLGKPEEKR